MIQNEPMRIPQTPGAVQVLMNNRIRPDNAFGTVGQRATLRMNGQEFGPEHPQYEMIKQLILQKYMQGIYGRR